MRRLMTTSDQGLSMRIRPSSRDRNAILYRDMGRIATAGITKGPGGLSFFGLPLLVHQICVLRRMSTSQPRYLIRLVDIDFTAF
jgi:hypothetical protein